MDFDALLRAAGGTPLIVSACLAGEHCRYDGGTTPHALVVRLADEGRALPVCPEMLGGLPAPREPVELTAGRALCPSGRDVTAEFRAGAQAALELARQQGCRAAILKARSPTCGLGRVYDGSFSGRLVPGDGMLAALLRAEGFALCTDLELPDAD